MRKVVVLTDPESADGFRLAGVDVLEVAEGDRAKIKQELVGLINDDDVGVVAINDNFMNEVDEATRARIDKLYRPIIVAIPARIRLDVGEARTSYLAKMIRRAVGFDLKV